VHQGQDYVGMKGPDSALKG